MRNDEQLRDLGPEFLRKIHKAVLIDEPWTEWGEREFAWIGHRLRQLVVGERPYEDNGVVLNRIWSQVVVVEDVSVDTNVIERFLARVNAFAIGSAYYLDHERKKVITFLAGRVHEHTQDWRLKQVEAFLACQIGQAETELEFLSFWCGGRAAAKDHPTGGRRPDRDEILTYIDSVFGARGEEPSAFANAFEFEAIEDVCKQANAATLGASEAGISVDVPFADRTALIQLRSGWMHPRVGNGLSVTLLLPLDLSLDEIGRIAGALNRAEAGGEYGYQSFGAWGALNHEHSGNTYLGHASFLLNHGQMNGMAMDAFYGVTNRARWANRRLSPGYEDVDAWSSLIERTKAVLTASESDEHS